MSEQIALPGVNWIHLPRQPSWHMRLLAQLVSKATVLRLRISPVGQPGFCFMPPLPLFLI